MSDSHDDAGVQDEVDGNEPSIFDQPEETDVALAWIVYLADAFGISQGVTLFMGGLVVSGQVISPKAYFEKMAARVMEATGATDTMKTHLSVFYDMMGKQMAREDEDHGARSYRYIHLEDARLFLDGQQLPNERSDGLLWRGKLSAVGGHTLGAMRAS